MTANADWPEITREISKYPSLENKDRDDIIARVFKGKLKQLLHDILKKNVLQISKHPNLENDNNNNDVYESFRYVPKEMVKKAISVKEKRTKKKKK